MSQSPESFEEFLQDKALRECMDIESLREIAQQLLSMNRAQKKLIQTVLKMPGGPDANL